MSPLHVACLTAGMLGGVFAFAAGLAIALGRPQDGIRESYLEYLPDPTGVGWLLQLLVDFIAEYPKASFQLKALFLSGCGVAITALAAYLSFP